MSLRDQQTLTEAELKALLDAGLLQIVDVDAPEGKAQYYALTAEGEDWHNRCLQRRLH